MKWFRRSPRFRRMAALYRYRDRAVLCCFDRDDRFGYHRRPLEVWREPFEPAAIGGALRHGLSVGQPDPTLTHSTIDEHNERLVAMLGLASLRQAEDWTSYAHVYQRDAGGLHLQGLGGDRQSPHDLIDPLPLSDNVSDEELGSAVLALLPPTREDVYAA